MLRRIRQLAVHSLKINQLTKRREALLFFQPNRSSCMDSFEKKEKMRQLLLEFEQVDRVHHETMLDIENGIYDMLHAEFQFFPLPEDISESLKQFAITLINMSNSVIDKDSHYPDYRLKEELANVIRIQERQEVDAQEFTQALVGHVKSVIIEKFPQVFDLSGDGFRLLDANISYHVNALVEYIVS